MVPRRVDRVRAGLPKYTLQRLMTNESLAILVMAAWIICRCALLAASMPFLSSSVTWNPCPLNLGLTYFLLREECYA